MTQSGYKVQLVVAPNKAAAPNDFAVEVTHNGKPVTGADVRLSFDMLDMQMPNQLYQLSETKPGTYTRSTSALVMVGHWGLALTVTPKGGTPFSALIVDHATG